ncbi:LOW QUALITY PROTEIN: ubiquitin carboxyl-terminal hydrolase 17-like [Durio zibethinus]|uniref:ubiquitinyl hydrolase 1 n=1 Tax=Durio zibethinus TaxID=66656 RepID=A0A6P6B7E3_DURZI|nr:LOW QUALITY PROTEIN: ubiquitin carboxyl-terminal hydrolase 17-like [Durio zibethinus]
MLLAWNLGFSSLVLVVSLVLPLIGFFIRRKWRLSVARQAEIKRLLILASEETARAELEASGGYGTISISRNYHQCAVCYCPTTTRCARCKAVRYCSAKCQIIHWRQGHKEECHPSAITTYHNHDQGSDSGQIVMEQDQHGDGYEIEEKQHAKPTGTSSTEPAFSNSTTEPAFSSFTSSSVVLHGNDDDIKVEFHADGEGTNSALESPSASFSGFSSSAAGSESSDDVSVCESISSNEPDKLEISSSADANLDMFWTASGVNNVDQTNPLSPKFARLVGLVDKFCKLNQTKPDQSGESQCRVTSSSGLGISGTCEGLIAEGCTLSSGFWGRTLESVPSTTDADNESFSTSLDSESSLHFSFNLSGNASSSHPQGSKVKASKLDDSPQGALRHTKLSDRVTLLENVGLDAPKVSNSQSSNIEWTNHMECGSSKISNVPKPREAINTDVPLVSSLSSSCFEKSGSGAVINGPSTASHPLKSSESSAKEHVVPSVKSGKNDGVNANAATLPQVSSCSSNGRHGLKTSMWKVVDQFRGSKLPKYYPFGVSNEVSGKYNDKGLFPYESFVKLYNWNKVELQPFGLVNCLNSCYANAVLQCLTFTPPLTAYFLQGLHSKACAKKEWCFTCEFENLILKAKDGKSPLSPIGILSQLQNIGSQLANGKEEDAHEFLRYAIDAMQSVCLKEFGVVSSGCLEEETTLIGLTFGGYLRSKIKCMKCHGKSERHERMMDLTVEIEGDIGTLEEALRRFTATEILDGENKYQCSRCKSYEKAKKKLTILEAPNVLTIALKRFQSGKFGKLNKAIQFPEILNLAPYMSGISDKSPIYRLYGVVVHLDIMNAAFSGHYVCYVKNVQNKWFKIDDSVVTSTELERVLTKGAYMLLYAGCSPRAPRLVSRSESIPSRVNSKNQLNSSSSTNSSLDEVYPSSIYPDIRGSIESFYSKYNRLQRILEEDSSDSSSLFSSNSDEGSCSTDSTRDSTCADDLLDSIFGDSIRGLNSPCRSSDSDASSSSSSTPLYSRHSPLADLDRYASGSPEICSSAKENVVLLDRRPSGSSRQMDEEGKGNDPFFHNDTSKQCRKIGSSRSRETDSERLGGVNPLNDVSLRKSRRERTE